MVAPVAEIPLIDSKNASVKLVVVPDKRKGNEENRARIHQLTTVNKKP